MADKKISQFPTDSQITGTELITGIDNGVNTNWTIQQIADFIITQMGGTPSAGSLVLAASGDSLILASTGDSLILA